MRYLDLTLPTPAENLALDEALLDAAEQGGGSFETLRLWEPGEPMVVVGRSSRLGDEVRLEVCRRRGVEVFRRSSGGAAVVTGPGCLMYAGVLSYDRRPELRAIDRAHCFVMQTLAAALRPFEPDVRVMGTSDLAIGERKFSGNSMRCKQSHFLYHGTLLYGFPLDLITELLPMPPRQPGYRKGRDHDAFVANLPLDSGVIRRALVDAWQAAEPYADWPHAATAQLAAKRYGRTEWIATR